MVAAPGDPTIGWGIIGCGDVVERKAGRALRTIPGSSIVAVMRRDGERAQQFAERHNVPMWTTDAGALIDDPRVNAIYVATPPEHHLEYALAACAAGKPCLIEKPAGRSDFECRQLVEAFRRADIALYIAYYRRDLAKFRKVKEIIASGALGAIVAINYRFAKPSRGDAWRLVASRSGGGHFYDLAGHVLDLFDDWFGALELSGSAVTNRVPSHETEDAVALTFCTKDGAIGNASWNFAAASHIDELTIEGLAGSLSLAAMSVSGSVVLQLTPAGAVRMSRSLQQRTLRLLKSRLGIRAARRYRFAGISQPHRPMLTRIVQELSDGGPPASPDAALRTSTLLNRVLDDYYGGRCDAFWERPSAWKSLRRGAARRVATTRGYDLDHASIEFFATHGYLGPLQCDGDWQRIVVPVKKGSNLHLDDPIVFDVCSHPSIVCRVAELLGSNGVALFKSRFVVKMGGAGEVVAWHQDVGDTNGGYYPDGEPVPSITCWLALDPVLRESGALRVVPGTHKHLYGNFHSRLRARLLEHGAITTAEIERAVTFELRPGQFYLFHSWILHASDANTSTDRRAGLNMRFARVGDEYEADTVYLPLNV